MHFEVLFRQRDELWVTARWPRRSDWEQLRMDMTRDMLYSYLAVSPF